MGLSDAVFTLKAVLGLDSSEYKKGLDDAKGDAEGAGSKIGHALGTAAKVGAAAMAAATTAAVSFGKSAVEAGLSFDATMSEVSAISGATGEDFDSLRNLAMDMGATTKFSASEAAEGLTYMAMAGWKTQDMLDGLPGILNLAAASGEDLGTTSDIVTDALTAFGLSAQDSGHFADVLAAASSNANTNVSMLGESFKYVATTAGALDYSAEDVAIALGLMANSGVKASQAGTALRTVMTNMSKPTAEMERAMETLGVSLQDDEGNMYSFFSIMQQLREGFGELKIPMEEYQHRLGTLNEQLEAGEIDENDYNKALMELQERAYGAEGALKAEAAAMLAGKEGMSGLLAIVNTSEEDFSKLTASIYTADGAAQQMADTMQNNLQGDLTIMKSSLEGVQLAISDELTPSLREFAQFGSSALSSISSAIREGGIEAGFEELGKQLGNAVNMISEHLPDFIAAAQSLLTAFVTAILDNAEVLTQSALEIIVMLVNGLLSNLPMLVQAAFTILNTLIFGLVEQFPTMIPQIVQVLVDIVRVLTDPANLELLVTGALQLIVALAEGLIQAIPELIRVIPDLIKNLVQAIIAEIPQLLACAVELIVALALGLVEAIPELVAAIPEILAAIVGGLIDGVKDIIATGEELIKGLWEGIKNQATFMWENLKEWWNGLLDKFKDLLGIHSPSTVFGEIGEMLIQGLWDGIKRIWENMTSWFSNAWESVVGSVKNFLGIASPSKVFADIGKNMALGVGEGWGKTFGGIEKSITGDMDFGGSISMRYARPQLAYAGNAGYGNGGINEVLRALQGMRVVMDTGETVGALATPMNGKLGDQYTYRKRGII